MPITNEPYDPIVVASWDTKPSPADSGKGRLLGEFDTGQSYISTGSSWKLLNGIWNTVLVQPSTDAYGNPQPMVLYKGTTLVDKNGVIQDSRAGTVGATTSTGGWAEAIGFALGNNSAVWIKAGVYGSPTSPLGQLAIQLPSSSGSVPNPSALTIWADGTDNVFYIGSFAGDYIHKYLGGVINGALGVVNIIGGYSVWNLNTASASGGVSFQFVRNIMLDRLKIGGPYAGFQQNMVPPSNTPAPPSGGVGFDFHCQSGDNFQLGPITVSGWDIGFQLGGDHLFMVNPETRYCNSFNFLLQYNGFDVHLFHPHVFAGSGPCLSWNSSISLGNMTMDNFHDENGNSFPTYGPRGATIDLGSLPKTPSLIIDGLNISAPSNPFVFLKSNYTSYTQNIQIRNLSLASNVGLQAQQTSNGAMWFDSSNFLSQNISQFSLVNGITSNGWTLNGTTSGQVIWQGSIPANNTAKVELDFSNYENTTTTPQTITSPLPFGAVPNIVDLTNNTAAAVTATKTVITLPASMTASKTGMVLLYGPP